MNAKIDIPYLLSLPIKRCKMSGFDLSGCDLRGKDLSGADLSNCKLIGANLSGANLSGSNLNGATLTKADLSGASVDGVSFKGVDLRETILTRVNLDNSDLTGAHLNIDQFPINISLIQTMSLATPVYFDRSFAHADMTVTANQLVSRLNGWISGHTYPFTSTGINSMTFSIQRLQSYMMIGLSGHSVDKNSPSHGQECSLMLYDNSTYYTRGRHTSIPNCSFKQGDEVTVEADCGGRVIVFIVNGNRSQPVPFPPAMQPPYRFSVDMYTQDDNVKVIRASCQP